VTLLEVNGELGLMGALAALASQLGRSACRGDVFRDGMSGGRIIRKLSRTLCALRGTALWSHNCLIANANEL